MSNPILEDDFDLDAISRALSSISDAAFRGDEGSVDHHKAVLHSEVLRSRKANGNDGPAGTNSLAMNCLCPHHHHHSSFCWCCSCPSTTLCVRRFPIGSLVSYETNSKGQRDTSVEGPNLSTDTMIIPQHVMARVRLSGRLGERFGANRDTSTAAEKEERRLGRDEYGRTPLHEAAMSDPATTCMKGSSIAARIVNKLLFYSMLQERKKDDDSARHAYTDSSEDDRDEDKDEEEMVRALLKDCYVARTPSLLSLENKKERDKTEANEGDNVHKVVVVLLPFFMNPFAVCDAGRTPLHEAARSGNAAVIKALLRGMTMITRLKRRVRDSLGGSLRETHENKDKENNGNFVGSTMRPHRAEEEDEDESGHIFCTAIAMVPSISRSVCPAKVSTRNLSSPATVGESHEWRWISQEDGRGRTAIHLAAANGRHEALRLLLRKLQRCCARQNEQTNMRGEAVVNNNSFLVERALLRKDLRGYTALHLAAARGKLECVKVILASERGEVGEQKKEVSPTSSVLFVEGRLGDYALHLAATNGHTEVVRFLVEKMAFHWSKTKEQEEGSKHFLVLARDRILNTGDSLGRTPYFLAASGDWSETMAFLVEMGCDTSIPNNKGKLAIA